MNRRPRVLSLPVIALAGCLLFAAAPAQGYVRLVGYNHLWHYGSGVSAYLASVVEFDNWCWHSSSYDCLWWYTASVYGTLQRDGGTVGWGFDYQHYCYPAGVYLYDEIPAGGGNYYHAGACHQAAWHGAYSSGAGWGSTWTYLHAPPSPLASPSI